MTASPAILFRCDGSSEIGLGHVVRCLALANELHDSHDCNVSFAMREGPLGIQMVKEKGYEVITPDESDQAFDYGAWLNECIKEPDARAIVFDVRDGVSRAVVKELRNNGILIVTIDDPEDKRFEADLAFYPPVPQLKRMDWTSFTGKLYAGWEWVILRPEFAEWQKKQDGISPSLLTPHSSPFKILVTMGGSDPAGLTIMAVEALNQLTSDFQAQIVIGPGFKHRTSLHELLRKSHRHFEIRENVSDMAALMSKADMAVASFGVTAYELAAAGVPSIFLCLTEDHSESASAFVDKDIALNLGVHDQVSESALSEAIRHLMDNESIRRDMGKRAQQLVDGRGTSRIAKLLKDRMKHD